MEDKLSLEYIEQQAKTVPYNVIYNYRFKPNATKRMRAEIARFYLQSVGKPLSDSSATQFIDEILSPTRIVMSNSWGKAWIEQNCYLISGLIKRKYRENNRIYATQILIALKCYKLDHGDLPETLDVLVPEYLDKVPADDFDSKPMKYSKKNKIVYSVGPDMKDSGGKKEWSKTKSPSGDNFLIYDDEGYKIEF